MPPGDLKAAGRQQRGQRLGILGAGGEFHELHLIDLLGCGKIGQIAWQSRLGPPSAVANADQAAMPVQRHQTRQARAELVVEDFKAQPAVIAGGHDGAGEAGHVQIALARHVAEMARPIQQIHVERRRIGHLHEKDLVGRDRANAVGVDLACQRVETVEDQTDVRVIGTAHHLPCVAVVIDEPAPAQRLITDADAVFGGQIAQFVEIGGHAVDAAHRGRMAGGTEQHQIGAQLVH